MSASEEVRPRKRVVVRRHRVVVEFHHVDMMKVVHNAQYFKWFEKGRFAIVDEILSMDSALTAQLLTPVVLNRCEYLIPARLGEALVLTVRHEVTDRWTGRFRFDHTVSNARNKATLACGMSEITVVDASTFRPVREIPETVWNCYQNIR